MAMYIDADNLIERLKFKRDTDINRKKYSGLECAISQVQKQPTANVVEVVRCKDCKRYSEPNDEFDYCHCNHCQWGDSEGWASQIKESDYCSYGERKCE